MSPNMFDEAKIRGTQDVLPVGNSRSPTCSSRGGGGSLGADSRQLRERRGVGLVQAAVPRVRVNHILPRRHQLRRLHRQPKVCLIASATPLLIPAPRVS